ncbi:MAG: DUF4291 family protein [Terricaulis sp.]
MIRPEREIRAYYTDATIRVYQAFSDQIADTAIKHQTFVSPPFSMNRMTWIKPSFLWMMYRACWRFKDPGQRRILAIDITHEGFEWALVHACPSHPDPGMSHEDWRHLKDRLRSLKSLCSPENRPVSAPLQSCRWSHLAGYGASSPTTAVCLSRMGCRQTVIAFDAMRTSQLGQRRPSGTKSRMAWSLKT